MCGIKRHTRLKNNIILDYRLTEVGKWRKFSPSCKLIVVNNDILCVLSCHIGIAVISWYLQWFENKKYNYFNKCKWGSVVKYPIWTNVLIDTVNYWSSSSIVPEEWALSNLRWKMRCFIDIYNLVLYICVSNWPTSWISSVQIFLLFSVSNILRRGISWSSYGTVIIKSRTKQWTLVAIAGEYTVSLNPRYQ
jgi:hypothetical protein